MLPEPIDFHGRPAIRLALPAGDTCTIALHGAQVLSWTTADGTERFYLSPDAVFDGKSAIRGGTPLCWPQFNARGPLPKHGFARNVAWTPEAGSEDAPHQATLSLQDDAHSRALWPHAFHMVLRVGLASGSLRTELSVTHRGGEPWSFAAALHSYLRVDDIGDVRLEGLHGANRWDSVRDERHVETAAALRFDSEFDSVYGAQAAPLRLVQPSGVLEISQSASCTETVVWNPGAALCATLADMPDDGYRHMLCVEAARIDEPVLLAPGANWSGWQQLIVR